ncbi:TIGR01777 family oxidoreductase [Cytobacillus sp. IB215665]|uniref:TIGR01777 family oxidoreductase n=1 Tax=Cytobacillus sp. IB215665 TaxID=3097357 RepID=UPI002A119890|nr:TIGR01777 family oxidoreductase [Cytobacillus sp. IB215665]MDX8367274.1 TIGR01777 family oxidoreductase [Cytobacillus sp. IB215665]
MKIAIAGGTGFVGKAITQYLVDQGHECFILTRKENLIHNNPLIHYVTWLNDDSNPESQLNGMTAFINLAGESLNSGRWTENRKKRIVNSRLNATNEIIRIITNLEIKPDILVNASGIGVYGTSEAFTFTEQDETIGTDFLAKTVSAWENSANALQSYNVRTVFARFGIILGKSEGALPKMMTPYKLFIGGTVGSGKQWLSWVHIDDVCRAIAYVISNKNVHGPVNITAPNPETMKGFGMKIGEALRKPHWLPMPAIALKLLLGEMSMLIVEGQKVLPDVLSVEGFTFRYQHLEDALSALLVK